MENVYSYILIIIPERIYSLIIPAWFCFKSSICRLHNNENLYLNESLCEHNLSNNIINIEGKPHIALIFNENILYLCGGNLFSSFYKSTFYWDNFKTFLKLTYSNLVYENVVKNCVWKHKIKNAATFLRTRSHIRKSQGNVNTLIYGNIRNIRK